MREIIKTLNNLQKLFLLLQKDYLKFYNYCDLSSFLLNIKIGIKCIGIKNIENRFPVNKNLNSFYFNTLIRQKKCILILDVIDDNQVLSLRSLLSNILLINRSYKYMNILIYIIVVL